MSDIEEYQDEHVGDFDTKKFCDCVYLVTSQVKEMEYLVRSYVEAIADQTPALPGALDELLPPSSKPKEAVKEKADDEDDFDDRLEQANQKLREEKAPQKRSRVSRIGFFFQALGGGDTTTNASSGSGLNGDTGDEIYGDDTAAVSGSFFQSAFKKANKPLKAPIIEDSDESDDDDANPNKIPPAIQYAASMSELKRLAEEAEFSDSAGDESSAGEGSDSSSSGSSDEDSSDEEDKKPAKKSAPEQSEDAETDEIAKKKLVGIPSVKAFRRASRILFGPFGGDNDKKLKPRRSITDAKVSLDSNSDGEDSDD